MTFKLLVACTVLCCVYGERNESDESVTSQLVRHVMMQQWYTHERVRSSGGSGISQVRHQRDGTRPYHTETHTGGGVCSIHDHADSIRTLGMGEVIVVLNGVEFTTRHNDYLLKMPHRSSPHYHATEDIPFPDVPPSVLNLTTVQAQIKEMREYFRAWQLQDPTIREYRPYFKPVISYLEGTWVYTGEEFEQPFFSERHWVAADTWRQFEEIGMFTSYSGTKEALENMAFLPKSIDSFVNGSIKFKQWNYRIMCHPLKKDLRTDRFTVIDDLASRMISRLPLEKFAKTREARFLLHPTDSAKLHHGGYDHTLLDKFMEEIPGYDNYMGNLTDEAFGHLALEPTMAYTKVKNAAFYHHRFRVNTKDGMSNQIRHRGYSDETLFMAMTSQDKVAGMPMNNCYKPWDHKQDCEEFQQKWTYAFPMEIIYLTPLPSWNPYNIEYKGWSHEEGALFVTADGSRDGTKEKPYNGTNSRHFFQTPAELFEGSEVSAVPADTSREDVYVLDSQGYKRRVRASGHRTFIPDMNGLGPMRQRYPIMPVHGQGGSVWKELEALKDLMGMLMDTSKFHDQPDQSNSLIWMGPASSKFGQHQHWFQLRADEIERLKKGEMVEQTTFVTYGHQHTVKVYTERRKAGYVLLVHRCDGLEQCEDGHSNTILGGFDWEWNYDESFNVLDDLESEKDNDFEGWKTTHISDLPEDDPDDGYYTFHFRFPRPWISGSDGIVLSYYLGVLPGLLLLL